MGGTAICVLLNVIAVGYLIAWHRYVDYMNGGDEVYSANVYQIPC